MIGLGLGIDIYGTNNFAPLLGSSAFVTTWNTENLGGTGSATKVILLPMTAGVEVDWGDGTVNNLNTHTYATTGIKTVKIADSVTGFRFNNGGDKLKITDVSSVGDLVIDATNMFRGCSNLVWSATAAPLITTTTLASTFQDCLLFNGNINNWDVSTVLAFNSMLRGTSSFNRSLNTWITTNTTSFNAMFRSSLFDQDISSFDFSGITDATNMFTSSSFSQTNYDILLPALDAQSLQSGVAFHAGNAQYGAGAPATARASIVGAPDLWTITDGGPA